jgi:hypothetical protein
MPTKKKKKDSTGRGKGDGGTVSGANKGKKSKKGGSRKTPPELLIAAASAGAASAVAGPLPPPEAAAASARGGIQYALRDVLRFQQEFKFNAKNTYLPDFGDTEEEKSAEEEEDKDDEEYYPFDKGLFEDEKDEILDDDYYRDTKFHGKGASGLKLTPGGPQKPDTTSMGEVEAEQVLQKWRKERKKYTDGVALKKRKGLLDDFIVDKSTYTRVLSDKI